MFLDIYKRGFQGFFTFFFIQAFIPPMTSEPGDCLIPLWYVLQVWARLEARAGDQRKALQLFNQGHERGPPHAPLLAAWGDHEVLLVCSAILHDEQPQKLNPLQGVKHESQSLLYFERLWILRCCSTSCLEPLLMSPCTINQLKVRHTGKSPCRYEQNARSQ